MIRLFKHHIPNARLLLVQFDRCLLICSDDLRQTLRKGQRVLPLVVAKPGGADWAQSNYPHGASNDASQKLEYEVYAPKNSSPFLDLLFLLRTIRVVPSPEGAR